MSRRHQLTRTPRTLLNLIIVCCAAALTLAGCGAGQVTQTDAQVAAIDGAFDDIGTIALRDVLIVYPDKDHGSYAVGSDVPLHFVIVNQGTRADELVSVSSPLTARVQLQGSTTIPAGMSVTSDDETGASPVPGGQPGSSVDFGELRIVLTGIAQELRPGLNTEVTFVFRDAGTVTVPVPMGLPVDSERTPLEQGGEHS